MGWYLTFKIGNNDFFLGKKRAACHDLICRIKSMEVIGDKDLGPGVGGRLEIKWKGPWVARSLEWPRGKGSGRQSG